MTAGRLHAVSLYWTFVDAIWIVMFVLLHLSVSCPICFQLEQVQSLMACARPSSS